MSLETAHKEAHAELITRCRNGDVAASAEIYGLYSKAMFNICLRMLNNSADAEDVLQESFISAFRNISQYSSAGSFGSWLKRIVINRCVDVIKKRNFNTLPLDNIEHYEEPSQEEDTIYFTIENIQQCIKLLPDGYRLILSLYLFEDLSHKSIAAKLGISEGTSKSQYSRARKKLVELIKLNTKGHE